MKPCGRILIDLLSPRPRYVIDAEPHIMSRVRVLFDSASPYAATAGTFTHRPIALPLTLASSRDVKWLAERYCFDVQPDVAERIAAGAAEYDAIARSVSDAGKDEAWRVTEGALELGLTADPHQISFRNMFLQVKRLLLADVLGLGKTGAALAALCDREQRPAVIVVPANITAQWLQEVKRFLPGASVHVVKGKKHYELPIVDVYITTYSRLPAWGHFFFDKSAGVKFKTLIMDEVQELRHLDTAKRGACRSMSEIVEYCTGLSATPIINQGSEIWSVLDAIAPTALGPHDDFVYEWCQDKKVREPAVLNSYLKSRGLMLRRNEEDVGLKKGEISRHVYTLDADLEQLKAVEDVMKMLAVSVLSGVVGEADTAGRDFDWKLRHATGVAKARPVAEFVKLLCEGDEKVILGGWHHDVYDIWNKELAHLKPVMITGKQTPAEKEAARQTFINDPDCKLAIMSVRTAAGIDGFQHVCSTAVLGELDWSPHFMDQFIGRAARRGQLRHVKAFFLTVADGADPFMMQILNVKRSQHDGLIEGIEAEAQLFEAAPTFDAERVREMARAYLEKIGEPIPVAVKEDGLFGEVARGLRRIRVQTNTEAEMQDGLARVLPQLFPVANVDREVRAGKKSRMDFLVSRPGERIAIECKIDSTGRQEVYRQVRRYAQEAQITGLVLYAPWTGISGFVVDGIPVSVVDYSAMAL